MLLFVFYCFFNLCKYSCGNISIFFISAFFCDPSSLMYLTYKRHFLFGLYCCHFIFNISFMENYTFFSIFWFTWSPVSKLVWILLLNSTNKAFSLNTSAAIESFCCDDSRLKGEEKWSVHVGRGLLLKKILLLLIVLKCAPFATLLWDISVAFRLSLLSLQEEMRLIDDWSVSAFLGTCNYVTGRGKPALFWMTRLRRRKGRYWDWKSANRDILK